MCRAVSRFFAPSIGVDEDFVTGSVHCALGPYWSATLRKSELLAYQALRRGGEIGVRVAEDRITLLGSAITVMSGRLE
jgi:predicted PhzF superfamily epimerase YddE/YHI9